jgi:translation initiation factor 2 alpha subunit (eIF-2alpha)
MATTHSAKKKWSADVTEHSDALDLESNIFESKDPKKIADSLKRSAENSTRKKSAPYRSAMSMLTFYINRAGKNLEAPQKEVLEKAKDELRKAFGRA